MLEGGCGRCEAEPMIAPFAVAITALAKVKVAIVAFGTVVVELVLKVRFLAPVAGDGWFNKKSAS